MEPITYEIPHARLRRTMWMIIVVAAIAAVAAGIAQQAVDPYGSWLSSSWRGLISLVAPVLILLAINVLGWLRLVPWLSIQEKVYRAIVIVCLIVLFALVSGIALLGLVLVQLVVFYP